MVSLMQCRAAVGLHNICLKAKEYSDRMKGKFWSTLLFMFYLEAIYLPTLKRVIHSWQMAYYARLWFTQMCLYRFYIPLLIRLANDVEMNPGPFCGVNSSKTVTADFHQGDFTLFGRNSGKQCVAMSLTAIVFNYRNNASWCREKMNEILIQGNELYTHLSNSAGNDFLFLSEIPSALSIGDEMFSINFSSSFAGDLHMPHTEDCYVPLQHALNMLIKDYDSFLLTIGINTVAIFIDNQGHYRIFDSHSRDINGNLAENGTAVLLEFATVGDVVQYFQNFYRERNQVSYEVLGVKVEHLSLNQNCQCTSSGCLSFTTSDKTVGHKDHDLDLQRNACQESEVCNNNKRTVATEQLKKKPADNEKRTTNCKQAAERKQCLGKRAITF